ncbi:MAG: RNA polymerase sigma factor [Solirubrobacterales bacterium]
MAKTGATSASKLPPKARRRAERLTELYEREAYRIYNLALRITCDRPAAERATESAFLRHVASNPTGSEDEQGGLLPETVSAALTEAPRHPAKADAEEPLIGATVALSPSQRAIIALISLDQASPEAIAAATGTSPEAANTVMASARERLAAELGVGVEDVDERLAGWLWAEPPRPIWEGLYPKAHRLLAERETATEPSEEPGRSGSALATRLFDRSPGIRGRLGGGLSRRGGVWAFRAAVLAIILVPAAVVALTRSGDQGNDNVALSAAGGPGQSAATGGEPTETEGGTTYDALSPKELDQLRLKELDDLRRFSQQQADQSLSAGERSDAEARAERLLAMARERLAEADRREQAVAEREKKAKAPAATTPAEPAPAPTGGKKRKKKKRETTTTPQEGTSVSDCLFNPQSGTYICPE